MTFVMGATLTLLVRHLLQHDLHAAGWKIGALYGINTAGAAAGAFLTDYAFVPAVGLRATQVIAVFLNLAAAFGALRLAGRLAPASPAPRPAPGPPPLLETPAGSEGAPRLVGCTAAALFLSGFAAMGMEIVWFRHIDILIQSYRAVFSLLLTVILVGIWLGSLGGGYLHRRFGHPALFFVLAQALFAAVTLLGLATTDIAQVIAHARTLIAAAGHTEMPGAAHLWFNVRPILREVAVPALVMGCAFPLANAMVQRVHGAVGRRAGILYLANTVGAVTGSLAAGFLLLPVLGLQQAATILMFTTALCVAAASLAVGASASPARRVTTAAAMTALVAIGAALALWSRLPGDHLLTRSLWPLKERVIAVREGVNEVLVITESPAGGRRLVTNGFSMSATGYIPQRYMRAHAHIPLLLMEAPVRALVICFGVGNTAHAASLHPSIRRLDVVDLSRDVLEHADYFAATNARVLRHPKVAVHVNDGRHHLRMQAPATYDLITLEPPPIAFAGVASLYSRDFYELARSRLTATGYITQWLPINQVPEATAMAMIRAFVDVFPRSVLLSGFGYELILMGTMAPRLEIDPEATAARVRGAPDVQRDLQAVDLASLTELVGTFVASGEALARASSPYPAVTDDYPIMEYASSSRLVVHRVAMRLFESRDVAAWCPRCFDGGKITPALAGLDGYLGALAQAYRVATWAGDGAFPSRDVAREILATSGYLRRYFETLGMNQRGGQTP
jgi:spermidine synthase